VERPEEILVTEGITRKDVEVLQLKELDVLIIDTPMRLLL
jgi:hypothetical protein